MDTFQKKFEEKTGKPWGTATTEEKRGFVQQYNATDKTQAADSAGTGTPNQQRSLTAGSTLEVRTQYKRQTGKNWADATPGEQQQFLGKFRLKEQKDQQAKQRNLQQKIAAQKRAETQKNREIRNKELAKQRADRERQRKALELEKARKAAQKKLADAMKRIERMRREAQRKHKR
ncbi:MAG: hypothetical protein HZA28_08740 [Candidatus Omnitrophica bacterium]|nr:hypothetical protein [Candidatus Omnitrophota bacterium]